MVISLHSHGNSRFEHGSVIVHTYLFLFHISLLHKTQNRLLQYHLGIQLCLSTFGALPPIQHFSDDICPLMMHYEL